MAEQRVPARVPPQTAGVDRETRDSTIVLGSVAVGFLFFELLRIWMPSLVVIANEARGAGPTGLIVFALLTFATGGAAAGLVGPIAPRLVWLVGSALLLGSRFGMLLVDGGQAQLTVATIGVAGGAMALVGLAGGSARGDLARLGILGGAALSVAVLAVLGSVDLTWRDGAIGTLGSLTVVALTALPLLRTTRALDGGVAAAALPWGALGPAFLLFGVLIAPAGRVAVATGWTPAPVALTTVGLATLLALGGLIAARTGPLLAGTGGAGLVLAGTAAALDADGLLAVAGQAALAVGLGLCVVSGVRGGRTSPRRRALVTAASLITFALLTFAAYAGALIRLPFGLHSVMLATAILVSVSAVVSTLRGARLGREATSPLLARFTAATVSTALLLALPATVRSPAEPGQVANDGSLRIALANVHYGFDVEGRQRALQVGALLADLDADIVALNEIDRGWLITGSPDLLSTYQLATGLTPVFSPATDEVWGNALLTRLPILEVQQTRLPRGRDALQRSALTVVLELSDGSPLGVVVTHLSHVDRQGDTRLPQAQTIAAIVARLRERGIPALVAGDLNARPGDPELEVLQDLSLVGVLPAEQMTFPDAAPQVQIDHILIPSSWEVLRSTAITTGLSDHRFVTTVIRPTTTNSDEDG